MVRVVALRKAISAGVAAAVAMEIFLRVLRLAGLPTVDLVAEMSSFAFGNSQSLAIGGALAAHLAIGVCWAVFYGYFFWARLRWPAPLQGLAFAAIPAVLAIFVVYPQLRLMHREAQVATLDLASFLSPLSLGAVGSLLAGHAVFGGDSTASSSWTLRTQHLRIYFEILK